MYRKGKKIYLTVSTGLVHLGIEKELIEEYYKNCIARLDKDAIAALES